MKEAAGYVSRQHRFRIGPGAAQGSLRRSARETLEDLLHLQLDEVLLRNFQETFGSEELPLETLLTLIEASILPPDLLKAAQRLATSRPHDPDSLRVLALGFGSMGQTAFAVASAQRAVRLAPHDAQIAEEFAHWQRLAGCLLANTAWLSKAALIFDELAEREPLHCDFPFQAGLLKSDLKLFRQAESSFREAIARHPRHARAHKFLGDTLKELGRGSDAQQAYLRAAELFTLNARNATARRSAFLFDEARDAYKQAVMVGYSRAAFATQIARLESLELETIELLET
ncbi:MAG: hypothetical protein J0M12_17175 [Deltaproteobacteria bacterium]|nr:hypothetical protein [Deltaproteobacteria bacterium]